jgi:hypothetical protein
MGMRVRLVETTPRFFVRTHAKRLTFFQELAALQRPSNRLAG